MTTFALRHQVTSMTIRAAPPAFFLPASHLDVDLLAAHDLHDRVVAAERAQKRLDRREPVARRERARVAQRLLELSRAGARGREANRSRGEDARRIRVRAGAELHSGDTRSVVTRQIRGSL